MALNRMTALGEAIQAFRADPVSGNPTAPPGEAQTDVNTLWGYGLWIFAVCAALGLLGCAILMVFNHNQGRSNDWGQIGKIMGACIGVGMIAGAVGAITGT